MRTASPILVVIMALTVVSVGCAGVVPVQRADG
jgi:hypothetical protein